MKKKLLLLELNELNFNLIQKYIDKGYLKNFKNLFDKYGFSRTSSELIYENIEPWIQWVTVHTGKDYEEHEMYHLNDYINLKHNQIWENLEKKGLSVAALFPMNAKNRIKYDNNIFIPDPWSNEKITVKNKNLANLHNIISFFVNNNTSKKANLKKLINLLIVFLLNSSVKYYHKYFFLILKSLFKKWNRVLFLDLLIFDVSTKILNLNNYNFTSVFYNGAAHIQHHYLMNSKIIQTKNKNPSWYLNTRDDPLLDIYILYDFFIKHIYKISQKNDYRLLIVTGLTQDPVLEPVFYYRLKNPEDFISNFNFLNFNVTSLMSRDFRVKFENNSDSHKFINIFQKLKINEVPIFDIKKNDHDLFVTLSYPYEIKKNDEIKFENIKINLYNNINFVAIKNGLHNGNGYYLDTHKKSTNRPLKELFNDIETYF